IPSVSGDDRGLDVAVAMHHVSQHVMGARKRRFPGDVVGGANLTLGDQSESPAHGFGRVMERRLQCDFRIVQTLSVEIDLGSGGAPAEEVDGAALSNHVNGPFPCFGTANSFDYDVRATTVGSQGAYGFDGVADLGDLNNFAGANSTSAFDLGVAFDDGDNVATDELGDLHEHHPDGAATYHGDRVADLETGFVETAQDAGQGLDHRRFLIGHVRRNGEHVGFNDTLGDANVFGVGSVVEEEIFAKIFLVLRAVEAHSAWCGVEGNDALAFLESPDAGAELFDGAGKFMAEEGRGNNHASVISALIDLEIGTTGQCDVDLDKDLAIANTWNRNLLDLNVLFTVEDCSCHLSVHSAIPSLTPPGWIAIFIVSGFGWAANFNASTACASGNRWLYKEAKSISRLKTNRTDSSCRSTEAL